MCHAILHDANFYTVLFRIDPDLAHELGRPDVCVVQFDLITLWHQHAQRALAARRELPSGIRPWQIGKQRRIFAHAATIA